MHARIEHLIELVTELRAEVRKLKEETAMATIALQRLTAAVAAEKTEIASAIAFVKGVPQLIRDAIANASTAGQTTEEALNDLAAQLEVQTADLTTALAANTPSAPTGPDATTVDTAPQTPPAT